MSLGVEWDWQVEDAASIAFGSGTEGKEWSRHFKCLKGLAVRSMQLTGRLPEVELVMGNGLRLLLLHEQPQPQWYVIDRREKAVQEFSIEDARACWKSCGACWKSCGEA